MAPYSSAMTELEVTCVPGEGDYDGWRCQVTVGDDDGSMTEHTVSVSSAELARLAGQAADPQLLVDASFRFLLSREPKESILRAFALSDIERYFPDYPRAIATR
jgi:hypothetical protein